MDYNAINRYEVDYHHGHITKQPNGTYAPVYHCDLIGHHLSAGRFSYPTEAEAMAAIDATPAPDIRNVEAVSAPTAVIGIGGIGVFTENEAPISPVQPTRTTPLVRCDCGHSVPDAQVMMASQGTSCPDCYDEMSD